MIVLLALIGCGHRSQDRDGDGWVATVDCNDRNPYVNPGIQEVPGDSLDNDCNLATHDDDYDQDGLLPPYDCDDSNPAIPGPEIPYDGLDNDCDPFTLDDDLDRDGFEHQQDCDDADATIHPAAAEVPYDGVDNDCSPDTPDQDLDGDGLLPPEDCDDNNPWVQQEAEWFVDCDGDGFAASMTPSRRQCEMPELAEQCGLGGSWTTFAPVDPPNVVGNVTTDCADYDPTAFPGQTQFFQLSVVGLALRWDHNCDGLEEVEYAQYECEVVTGGCVSVPGFLIPTPCGVTADFQDDCVVTDGECREDANERQQRCL